MLVSLRMFKFTCAELLEGVVSFETVLLLVVRIGLAAGMTEKEGVLKGVASGSDFVRRFIILGFR